MKQTMYSRAMEKVKNNWASVLVTTTVSVCTAMVLFARCNGCVPMTEGPIRGDGVCEQSEAYPYEMGKDRTFKRDKKGDLVPNKNFAPEDCHVGDGVLQTADNMKDMAGNPITLLPRFVGKEDTVGLPEGQDSIDARLSIVRGKDTACIPGTPTPETKKIDRPLIKANPGEEIIRPIEEWEQMVRDPSSLPPSIYNPVMGRNSFKRPWLLEETCDTDPKVPDCAPNINEKCYAANHVKCPPRKPEETKPKAKCNNKKWEKALGEVCDSTYKKNPKGSCKADEKCSSECGCIPKSEPLRCGDKIVQKKECHAPGESCGENGTCTDLCMCKEEIVPPTDTPKKCPENVKTDQGLFDRVNGRLVNSAGALRTLLGVSNEDINFAVSIRAKATGAVSILNIGASCGSSPCPTPASTGSIQSTSKLNLSGISTATHEEDCDFTLTVTVPKEGSR